MIELLELFVLISLGALFCNSIFVISILFILSSFLLPLISMPMFIEDNHNSFIFFTFIFTILSILNNKRESKEQLKNILILTFYMISFFFSAFWGLERALYFPMLFLYLHVFYLKHGGIKEAFKNLNVYFYSFFVFGLLFLTLISFLYSVPEKYQFGLYWLTVVISSVLIPVYYYGLAPTFTEVMKAREAEEVEEAEEAENRA